MKTSLTDAVPAATDSLSEDEQLYVKNRISEIDRNLSSRGSSTMAMAPSTVTWWRLISLAAITQNSEVVVIRKNTAATMEGYPYVPATWGAWRKAIRSSCARLVARGQIHCPGYDVVRFLGEVNIDAHSALILPGRTTTWLKCASSWFTDPTRKSVR